MSEDDMEKVQRALLAKPPTFATMVKEIVVKALGWVAFVAIILILLSAQK